MLTDVSEAHGVQASRHVRADLDQDSERGRFRTSLEAQSSYDVVQLEYPSRDAAFRCTIETEWQEHIRMTCSSGLAQRRKLRNSRATRYALPHPNPTKMLCDPQTRFQSSAPAILPLQLVMSSSSA